jgi:hypothetical protein
MSCLGVDYNPQPPSVWSRTTIFNLDISYNELLMNRKVSSLAHSYNSGGLTQKQIYANIASGKWTSKKVGWALNVPDTCPTKCLPVSFSGVPGRGFLCSPIVKPVYTFGRAQTTYAGGSNFPDGYKFI